MLLVNALKNLKFLTAAISLWSPIDMRQSFRYLQENCFGVIGYDLKMTILSFNRDNKKVLDPFYREKYGYGIDEKIEELSSKNELNF